MIYGRFIARHIPRHHNPCVTVAVLSLHTALPVRRSPLHPSPCPLPTDLLYTALFTTEKTPISQIPDADRALSLAADLRWPTGFHFDRRLQLVASPTAQSLTDASSCHYNSHHTRIAHVFRLIFDVRYDGNVLSGVTQRVGVERRLFGGIGSGYCID